MKQVAKVTCQAGPANGVEFTLDGDEVVIGRASDNGISIPDTSMSRKHALLRKTATGWAISDLGSGNGTVVNGAPIAEETELNGDDVITVGDTELVFSTSGGAAAAAAPEVAADANDTLVPAGMQAQNRRPPVRTARQSGEAPPRRPVRTSRNKEEDPAAKTKKKRMLALIVVLALFVVMGGIFIKAANNKRLMEEAERRRASAERVDEMKMKLQEAKTFVRQGKFTDAKAKLLEIKEADEEFEAKSVSDYLQVAEREIPNQQALATAQAAASAGKYAEAMSALRKVTPNTMREADVMTLKGQIDQALNNKTTDARALLSSQNDLAKMEQLKALAEELIAARPDDANAQDLKRMAEQAINRIKNPTVAPPTPETPWLEVQARFRNGDSSGAQSLAQNCSAKAVQCRTLEAQIKEFESKNKNLESLGPQELYGLFDLDRKISGGQSSEQSKPLRTRLVATLFLEASRAKTSQNWSKAVELCRKVIAADSSHAGAQALIAEARTKAKDLYLQAYQAKDNDTDQAVKLFKEVVQMSPADDEYHQKAEARLKELQGR